MKVLKRASGCTKELCELWTKQNETHRNKKIGWAILFFATKKIVEAPAVMTKKCRSAPSLLRKA
jgi:hypothetical protein